MCCVGKRGSQPDLSASHHPYGEQPAEAIFELANLDPSPPFG